MTARRHRLYLWLEEGFIALRILHIANHCNQANGHVHVAVDMACTQAAQGLEVGYASAGGDYVTLMQTHGVRIFALPEPHRKSAQFFAASVCLARILHGFKPDVVHIHMAAHNVLVQPFRLLGLKTVTTVHNEFAKSVKVMGWATRVVNVSRRGAEAMRGRGVAGTRSRVVINGPVGSPRLPAQFAVAALRHPALVTVCGMHPRKGVADLLHAFALLYDEFPDAYLYLVGEGPMRAAYESLAESLGGRERVVFTGHLADPRPYLSGADIFVLASHSDPGPLVIAEARHAGCAIVATDVDGIPEMLDDGAAGLTVPPKQPEALAAAIRGLLAEPTRLVEYKGRAKTNSEKFTVERVCRDMEAIYAELLPAPPPHAVARSV